MSESSIVRRQESGVRSGAIESNRGNEIEVGIVMFDSNSIMPGARRHQKVCGGNGYALRAGGRSHGYGVSPSGRVHQLHDRPDLKSAVSACSSAALSSKSHDPEKRMILAMRCLRLNSSNAVRTVSCSDLAFRNDMASCIAFSGISTVNFIRKSCKNWHARSSVSSSLRHRG